MSEIRSEKVKFTMNGEEWQVNTPVVHLPISKLKGDPMRENTKGEILLFAKDGNAYVKIGNEIFRARFEPVPVKFEK